MEIQDGEDSFTGQGCIRDLCLSCMGEFVVHHNSMYVVYAV